MKRCLHLRRLRLGCSIWVCLGWTLPCHPAEVSPELLACRDLQEPAVRLSCFDREMARLPTRGSVAVAATPSPVSAPPAAPLPHSPALDPQQAFGLPERAIADKEVAAGTRASDAEQIEAHILQITTAPDRRMVFTLDNNQVWRQLAAEGDLLAAQGDAVKISRALFGSFWLHLPSGRGCKVTRLR
jgi:hypothetical protein